MKKTKLFYLIIFITFNLFFLPVNSDPLFDKGKDIFLNIAVCSTCHTLADAGSDGQIGPNLNDIRPDKMRVVNTVQMELELCQPTKANSHLKKLKL